MKPTPEVFAVPRTLQQWAMILLQMVVFAVAAHFGIGVLQAGIGVQSEMSGWLHFGVSLLYTSIIISTLHIAGIALNRFIPMTSKKTAGLHIVTLAFTTLGGFLLAQQAEILLFGSCAMPAGVQVIGLAVTFALSLIGNSMYYIVAFYRRARMAEQRMLESELMALRSQINPHFLFNSLNSIAALIHLNPDEAEAMTERLADLFRYSLRAAKAPLTSLEHELESLELYFAIEKVRFGSRLTVVVSVPPDVNSAKLPSLILQPLAENAIKHGASATEGQFEIRVEAIERDGAIAIAIRDSGAGFDLTAGEQLFERGAGLGNVRDRIMLAFPGKGAMRIEKNAVVLLFPFEQWRPSSERRTGHSTFLAR